MTSTIMGHHRVASFDLLHTTVFEKGGEEPTLNTLPTRRVLTIEDQLTTVATRKPATPQLRSTATQAPQPALPIQRSLSALRAAAGYAQPEEPTQLSVHSEVNVNAGRVSRVDALSFGAWALFSFAAFVTLVCVRTLMLICLG